MLCRHFDIDCFISDNEKRASLFCMAMASGLNVIVHWNGIASYDMIYVGR